MKYNIFIFMSDIKDKDPEDIVVSFIKRDMDRLIVEILPDGNPTEFKKLIDALQQNDIKFDCFIAAYNVHMPANDVKKIENLMQYACTKGMFRLWLRVIESSEPQDLAELVTMVYSSIIGHRPLVILSQIPYFYKPGSLTHALISTLEPKNVSVSPILKLTMSKMEMEQANKALSNLKTSWNILPTVYYPLENDSIDDENYDYLRLILPQTSQEISLLSWRSTYSSLFSNFHERLKGDLMSKKEKNKVAKKTRSKKLNAQQFQKVVVLSKHLAKRTHPSRDSEATGNYKQGEIIEVKRIFSDGASVIFAETTEGHYIYVQDGDRKFVKVL